MGLFDLNNFIAFAVPSQVRACPLAAVDIRWHDGSSRVVNGLWTLEDWAIKRT